MKVQGFATDCMTQEAFTAGFLRYLCITVGKHNRVIVKLIIAREVDWF